MNQDNGKEENKVRDITEVLEIFGKYQKMQFFYCCLAAMLITMININYIFTVGDLNYRCRIPECDSSYSSHPSQKPDWWPDIAIDRCSRPVLKEDFLNQTLELSCSNTSFTGEVEPCDSWIYESNDTVVAEVHRSLIPFFIVVESSGKNHRILAGVICAFAVYLGEALFAYIAMVVPHWKTLVRIISTPPIFFLSYTVLIRENPRWQILNKKIKQARKTLLIIAETNKLNIDEKEIADIDEAKLKSKFHLDGYEEKESWKKVFSSKEILKRLLVMSYSRLTASFVYYGMMINSVWLPGDKYTNFLLSTVMCFPGELIALVLMSKVGRRMPLIYGYLICALLCIASGYVSNDSEDTFTKISLFLASKVIISACFTGVITYTMELFPTSVRGTLMGICSFTSRVGGIMAPLTPILIPVSDSLPSILFGITSIIAGISLTLTPETRNLPLLDTVDQVETSVRQKETKDQGNDSEGFDGTMVSSL